MRPSWAPSARNVTVPSWRNRTDPEAGSAVAPTSTRSSPSGSRKSARAWWSACPPCSTCSEPVRSWTGGSSSDPSRAVSTTRAVDGALVPWPSVIVYVSSAVPVAPSATATCSERPP